ncbi:MAG: hypothetical protein HY549_09685 [Elusimicrobia bacterium]|nr:hypothetical protein [Elusimicrobiota bacterium]
MKRFDARLLMAGSSLIFVTSLIVALGPQTAVDLRPVPRPSPPSAPPKRVYVPHYDLIASGWVIGDLVENARLLRFEVDNYSRDTEALWGTWKACFGLRGGLLEWSWFRDQPQDEMERIRLLRFQTELFRVESRSQQIQKDIADLISRLDWARSRWTAIRDSFVIAKQSGEENVDAFFQAPLAELRSSLAQAAAQLNSLDSEIRTREEELDDIFPRFERLVAARFAHPLVLRRPWHWNHMLSGQPRVPLSYDFEKRYFEALSKARQRFPPSR